MAAWGAALVAGILAGAGGPARPVFTDAPAAGSAAGHAATPGAAAAAAGLPDLSGLAASALPAVVGVVTTQAPPEGVSDAQLKDLFERLNDGPRKGIGSGFVVHRDGWVVTNAHVVEGAQVVEVDFGADDPPLRARVVGADAESDVALLKVDAGHALPVIPLGDSDKVTVAEWVLVIGSPFGLDHSVTLGIVSHTGRSDISPVGRPGTYDFIQTDASINPGNSGGPVLNLRGEVIAIATAVNATGQGIGFAVPINMAKEILGQLRDKGRVDRSWLGIAVRSPEPGERGGGVVITEVAAGGPAASAGLAPGDVITGFGGREIRTPSRLRWYASTAGIGRAVEVKVRRGDGPERAIQVSLAAPPVEGRAAQARAAVKR
jgi:serine protease Do